MKRYLFIITFLLFNLNNSDSQPAEEWTARYNGPDDFNDAAGSVAVDNSGNVYVTGSSFFKTTFDDIITIKYNSSGMQLWIRRFNSADSSNDIPFSITVDNSGNVVVTGESLRKVTGKDLITIKYSPEGDLLWNNAYNHNGNIIGQNDDIGLVMTSDAADNIFIGGTSQGANTGFDFILLKYNSDGNLILEKRATAAGDFDDKIHDLKLDRTGNIFITGEFVTSTGLDYMTIKYTPSGNQLWAARYDGPISFGDIPYSMCIDDNGNVYVTGVSYGETLDDILTVKYNPSGIKLWEARYDDGNFSNDHAYSIAHDKSGYIYLAGGTTGQTGFPLFSTLKYDTSGAMQWIRYFTNPNAGSGEANLIKIVNNNIFVAGCIRNVVSEISNEDFALLEYDENGNKLAQKFYNGPIGHDDIPSSLQTDNSGNIYVTGESKGDVRNYDFATIKYSLFTSVIQASNAIPYNYELKQNFPNPFNPVTTIKYSLTKTEYTTLKIYNSLGNEITTIVDQKQNAGYYSVNWNAHNFSSGLYFYKLNSGTFTDTKKMVLIK